MAVDAFEAAGKGGGCAMRDPDETSMIGRLKRRADFLHVADGRRWHGKALSLQAKARTLSTGAIVETPAARVGFTLTKKVGNAVVRNRVRRRLKEALRTMPDLPVAPGHDYVIVGRVEAVKTPFDLLKREIYRAIVGVHDEARAASRRPDRSRPKRTRPKP